MWARLVLFCYLSILLNNDQSTVKGQEWCHQVHSLMSAVTMSCMLSRKLARCCVDVWWGEVIWATTAAASARAASTLLSSVKMSARHRMPSTYTLPNIHRHFRNIIVTMYYSQLIMIYESRQIDFTFFTSNKTKPLPLQCTVYEIQFICYSLHWTGHPDLNTWESCLSAVTLKAFCNSWLMSHKSLRDD